MLHNADLVIPEKVWRRVRARCVSHNKGDFSTVAQETFMDSPIEFQLSVQDEQATDEELQSILRTLAAELENQSATVDVVPCSSILDVTIDLPPGGGRSEVVQKGEPSSSILDVKINLDTLKTFGKWLYERLVGTTTKVEFEYGEAKFKFEGRNNQDRAAAMQDFNAFVAKVEAMKQAKHG